MGNQQLMQMKSLFASIKERLSNPNVDLATARDIVECLHWLPPKPKGSLILVPVSDPITGLSNPFIAKALDVPGGRGAKQASVFATELRHALVADPDRDGGGFSFVGEQ
jgi:hypothetical protein